MRLRYSLVITRLNLKTVLSYRQMKFDENRVYSNLPSQVNFNGKLMKLGILYNQADNSYLHLQYDNVIAK